ncbi:MAG: DUF924 domain-containing protein [Betaproteobacteria bacterium]|nr:DUF924 domain-containing protein [Betaproteobacteria bacterium]
MPRNPAPPGISSDDILDFWFGAPDSAEYGRPRAGWFAKDAAFDAQVGTSFREAWELAAAGGLENWRDEARAALALVVLLDQFPRNMFRGEARAFASDARALAVASGMVDRGFDRALRPIERWFVYLPFEHAEDPGMQQRSLELFAGLTGDADSAGAIASAIDYARRHHAIIARFGRFPHRNAVLGRMSTPEEAAFLQQPGSGL